MQCALSLDLFQSFINSEAFIFLKTENNHNINNFVNVLGLNIIDNVFMSVYWEYVCGIS